MTVLESSLARSLLSSPAVSSGLDASPGETLWDVLERTKREYEKAVLAARESLSRNPLSSLVARNAGASSVTVSEEGEVVLTRPGTTSNPTSSLSSPPVPEAVSAPPPPPPPPSTEPEEESPAVEIDISDFLGAVGIGRVLSEKEPARILHRPHSPADPFTEVDGRNGDSDDGDGEFHDVYMVEPTSDPPPESGPSVLRAFPGLKGEGERPKKGMLAAILAEADNMDLDAQLTAFGSVEESP